MSASLQTPAQTQSILPQMRGLFKPQRRGRSRQRLSTGMMTAMGEKMATARTAMGTVTMILTGTTQAPEATPAGTVVVTIMAKTTTGRMTTRKTRTPSTKISGATLKMLAAKRRTRTRPRIFLGRQMCHPRTSKTSSLTTPGEQQETPEEMLPILVSVRQPRS